MADAKPTSSKPASSKPKGDKRKIALLLLLIISLALSVVIRHTFLFMLVALLPTIVAYIVDRSEAKSTFQSVMACNLAGMLPYFAKMIHSGNSPSLVQMQMSNVLMWLVIYGAAAIGWCMLWLWPYLAFFIIKTMAAKETFQLDLQQRKLTEEWGPEIKRKE